MKRIIRLVFIPIFLFCLINCTSNSNSTHDNNSVQREYRFYEKTGGFSLIIPVTWKVMDMPQLSKYKTIGLPKEKGFSPIVMFSIDKFDGSLVEMNDTLINVWGNMHSDFELAQRNDFSTYDKLNGEKFILKYTMYGQRLRQVIYSLPGKNNSSILIFCNVQGEAGDLYDKTLDNYVRTFEWMEEKINKQENRRFFEEKGRFSLIPPEPWEAIDALGSEYKAVKIRDENGFLHFMEFKMINHPDDYDLRVTIDYLIEVAENIYGDNLVLLQRNDFITLKKDKGEKLIFSLINKEGQFKLFQYYILGKDFKCFIVVNCVSPIQLSNIFDEKLENTMKSFEWVD